MLFHNKDFSWNEKHDVTDRNEIITFIPEGRIKKKRGREKIQFPIPSVVPNK